MADNEIEFPNGLMVKAPRDGAPDFVKAAISIKREELIEWLENRDGDWINLDVKEAKSGHWYAAVNTFKPKQREETKPGANVPAADYDDGDSIPF
jgi:hypothetical protein